MSTAGFYDVRALKNNDIALTCDDSSSPCAFALGAEVQTLDVYSGDTNDLDGGKYKLSFTPGEVGSEVTTADCIDYNAEAGALEAKVESLTGISNGDVLVAREAITDPGPGYRYWITFVGAAVFGDVRALEIVDTAGCTGFTVGGVATTQHQLSVETQVI